MVVVKFLPDELEDLRHELHLVELGRGCQEADDELDEAIYEAVIKCVVVEPPFAELRVLGELD